MVVIPARWGSTRFPGKPLAPVAGHTLLARVIDLAHRATRGMAGIEIVVATDDRRIIEHAQAVGAAAVMTDSTLVSGSGRTLAAALARPTPPSHLVNLQGDAPFLPPEALRHVLSALRAGAKVATPVVQLSWSALDALRAHKRAAPFSGATCIRAANGDARWFSKAIIPAIRSESARRAADRLSPVFRHLGLYGYTLDALRAFEAAPPSEQEQLEGLEQLRFFELGIPIRTVPVEPAAISIGGIDTPHDVKAAENLIARHGDPFGT